MLIIAPLFGMSKWFELAYRLFVEMSQSQGVPGF
jgi:hypothetical protein